MFCRGVGKNKTIPAFCPKGKLFISGKFPFFHWSVEIFLAEKRYDVLLSMFDLCMYVFLGHISEISVTTSMEYNAPKDGHAPMIHLSHSSNALHNINKWVSVEFSWRLPVIDKFFLF